MRTLFPLLMAHRMSRYFLELAFNGTAYRGWQVQPDAPSVQGEIERAMRQLFHAHKVNVVGCGRTDTGVHASLYYAHFDAPEGREVDQRMVHSLNSMLPRDIAIHRAIPVAGDAHARFSATERGYIYRIHIEKDPFLVDRSHPLRPPLDVAAMNQACEALLQARDFTSFSRTGSDNRTMICDVRQAYWQQVRNGYLFRIHADRFLRNMVRAIVGTCLRIGKGDRPPTHMSEVLAAMDRHAAGRSAPACGLYLAHVRYPFIPLMSEPLNTGLSI